MTFALTQQAQGTMMLSDNFIKSTVVVLALLINQVCWASESPLTRAESSDYSATSRYADVMAFIHALQRQSDLLRVETLGISPEGNKIPLLVIGSPVPSSPTDLNHDDRVVVYFQANIHAGEVEGKEAALMLARSLALDQSPDILDRLVVLIAPIFNVDGNDKISPDNRPRQNGPAEGVGIRLNGRNQDLNRDGIKLESPEVRGLVQNVLNRWDPVFFLDAHTHNGSYHEEPVTWVWGLNPLGDLALFDFMENVAWPEIEKRMRKDFNTLTIPHGDFLDPREPGKGWIPLGPEPRYLSNYVGMRNRLAVLDEQYPYADFRVRVQGSYHLMISFLDLLHDQRDRIVMLITAADRQTIERGLNPSTEDVFIVKYGREALEHPVTIHGYELEVKGEGRYASVRPTETRRTYPNVPYLAKYTPKQTVRFPRGYLISVSDAEIIDKLLQHGIVIERLVEPVRLPVEIFTVDKLTGSGRSTQGHYTSTVEGRTTLEERDFPAGTYLVRTAQPLANVAAYLLEPQSDDGLVFWNYFDR
ncbi:MAG: M14 family metallopeptidase, partial [Gammaproteobacteria bacterium]|nr:M14 family metallopeptidase [Gammaproteobacteria bacterium]